MDRHFAGNVSGTAPAAPTGAVGFPRPGNPSTGTPATKPGPYWYHMITEELRHVIDSAGITPDHLVLTQLKQALDALYMPISSAYSAGVRGAFRGISGSAPGSSAVVSYSVSEIVVGDSGGVKQSVSDVSGSINMALSGVGGIDVGSVSANTWYYPYVITKPDGSKSLIASLSSSSPSLPSGYTKFARIGAFRTDGSANKYPLAFKQYGRRVKYAVQPGTNVASMPLMASGVAGNISTPTWVSVALGAFIPPTAVVINGCIGSPGVASVVVMAAPSNSYGGFSDSTNPPPVSINSQSPSLVPTTPFSFVLDSSSIYWASSAAGGRLFCAGWEDDL